MAFAGSEAASLALSALDLLAERRISEAIARGELDDLPGTGKPLRLEDDTLVPEELRAAYRLLRTAGYVPPDVQLAHEIRDVEDLLRVVEAPHERTLAIRRLAVLRARLGEGRARALALARRRPKQLAD